jgi:hypothetical protein
LLPLICSFVPLFRRVVPVRISAGQAGHFGSQPDALGRGRHREDPQFYARSRLAQMLNQAGIEHAWA